MGEDKIRRRDLLKTGSSLGVISLAGCSESFEDHPSISTDSNDQSRSPDEWSVPEPVEEYTLPSEHTVDEWHGTLELNEEQSYWIQEISPPEPEGGTARYGQCHILECEVDASDSILSNDQEANLVLIPYERKDDFEDATQVENCWEVQGYELTCTPNFDQYDRDGVSGDVVRIGSYETGEGSSGDEIKYTRYLLPDRDFFLAIDASNAVEGEYGSPDPNRTISEMDLETKVRVLDHSFENAQAEAVQTFQNWFSERPSDSPDETMSDAQQFAQEVCDVTGIDEIRSTPVEELGENMDQAAEYGEFVEELLRLVDNHYQMNPPVNFINQFNRMMRWGSTAVPIVASAAAVAENGCDLAYADLDTSEEESAAKVEAFLSSIASLVVQIIFLKWGVARQVSRAIVGATETFVLGYIREVAGLRLFAYLVQNLIVEIEQSIIQSVRSLAERIFEEIGDFITRQDLDLLDDLSEDDDSWEDMAFLDDSSCNCDSLGYTEVCHSSISM